MDLHVVRFPVGAQRGDLAVVVYAVGEDTVELCDQAVRELDREGADVRTLVAGAEGTLKIEQRATERDVRVPELLDGGFAAMPFAARVDHRFPDGVLHDGVVGEVVEPRLLVAASDGIDRAPGGEAGGGASNPVRGVPTCASFAYSVISSKTGAGTNA